MLARCPYCKEEIQKEAIRCKHCHSNLGGNENADAQANEEGFRYLQNGFAKINSTCDAIEDKIYIRTGFIFVKHQYSSDELLASIRKIESFVGKMKADLEEWESIGRLTQQVMALYNKKAGETYQRLEDLHREIERREPTWWENVSSVFHRIFQKLLSFFSFKLIAGRNKPKEITA